MKTSKGLFTLAVMSVVFLCSMFFLKNFNFKWVQVTDSEAMVTINFLFPMNQDKFADSISLTSRVPNAESFDCMINWLSDTTVQLRVKEQSAIKGQKINLKIQNAPTANGRWVKNEEITISFRSDVKLMKPNSELLISTENAFEVKFNTPMDKKMLHKYLQSDAKFKITESKVTLSNGQEVVDDTSFIFTPQVPLENNKKYILSFRKGMPSQSGVMLKEDINIVLNTDSKPQIIETYPENGNNWVGLYPRVILHTDTPIEKATLYFGERKIEPKVLKSHKAEFLFDGILKHSTEYTIGLEVEVASGEKSLIKSINFTTVPIKEDRIWVEVILGKSQKLIVYKGHNPIKTMVCSGGAAKTPTLLGTYYITDKGEKFFDDENNEGANAWIRLSEGIKIHAVPRDEYWTIKQNMESKLGTGQTKGDIILSEEDAVWLYQNLPVETMVIIHE